MPSLTLLTRWILKSSSQLAVGGIALWASNIVNAVEFDAQAQLSLGTAVELSGEVQVGEMNVRPRIDARFTDSVKLTGIALARADLVDKLEPGRPSNASRSSPSKRMTGGDRLELEIRELFLDFELGNSQLRLGKQQVVWGQADGLRILDLVNPLNYREFVLGDFENRRIPLWMLNTELEIGPARLQFLWIPDQTYDDIPNAKATFAFTSPTFRPALRPGEKAQLAQGDKPSRLLQDSDFGLRLSTFTGGWDLTANYLYHYQDQPVLELDRSDVITTINPVYKRTHLIGGSASTAFGNYVLRSELGYSTHRYFSSTAHTNGTTETQELSGVAGIDYSGWTNTFVSGQIFVGAIDQKDGIIRERTTLTLSLLMQQTYLNDSISVELLAIHNIKNDDGLVQFDLGYQMSSSLVIKAGVDIFYGEQTQLFGQFDHRDRFRLMLEWSL